MKSRYKVLTHYENLYFLTLNVHMKVPVFTDSSYMNLLIENFNFYRETQNLKIYAYVIMDNHLHLIASHPDNLSDVLRNFKSYTAKILLSKLHQDKKEWILHILSSYKPAYKKNSKFQFWQEGNHPKLIQTMEMLNQKIVYIHNNPVKRGLVEKGEDWMYSSAKDFYGSDSVFKINEIV